LKILKEENQREIELNRQRRQKAYLETPVKEATFEQAKQLAYDKFGE
jgi:hypothetical protein